MTYNKTCMLAHCNTQTRDVHRPLGFRSMRLAIGLFLLISVAHANMVLAQSAVPAADLIHYTVRPLAGANGVDALEVELRFVGNLKGQSTYLLPSNAIGGRERWKYLSHFAGAGVRIVAKGKDKRIFLYRPGSTVIVRYRVRSAYAEDPAGGSGNPFAGAVVRPHWLATLGEFIFIAPEDGDATPVSFHWEPGAAQWGFLSNLDDNTAEDPLTVARLVDSSIIASRDLRVVNRPIFGGMLRIGAVGSRNVSIEHEADLVAQIVSAQRAFWGDMSGPYTVTTLALAGSGQQHGGTGRHRSFAQYITATTTDAQQIRMIAHEHVHSWIPHRLGEMPSGPDEAALYWFSEGFADFYAQRTLLRSGIWTLEDFVRDLNETLDAYAASPYNQRPNDWTSARFWSDGAIQRIPYWRGNLFAYLVDNQVRQALQNKAGLDQLIFRMRDRWLSAPSDHRPGILESLRFSYRALLGADDELDALIESHITKGEFIRLPANMFGNCATIDSGDSPSEHAPQTIRLASMDEHQREVCARTLP
jgi:predicted metalloprotease with PDZ domain